MKKISLAVASIFILSGCNLVDDAINAAVSGDVTAETMKSKDKVVIINEVSLAACVVLKNGLIDKEGIKGAVTLVEEVGVTCAAYNKTVGDSLSSDTKCVEQSLAEWLEEDHEDIADLETAQGDKACVIGSDA